MSNNGHGEDQLDPIKLVELSQRALAASAHGIDFDELTDAYFQSVDVDEFSDACDQGVDVDELEPSNTASNANREPPTKASEIEAPEQTTSYTSVEHGESDGDALADIGARSRSTDATLQQTEQTDETEEGNGNMEIRPTGALSPRQTIIARNESNGTNYVMKVVEARACRAATMNLQRVQYIDRQDSQTSRSSGNELETNFDLLKGVEAPFCDTQQQGQLSFFRHNIQTLERRQPGVINPTVGQVVQAVNQSVHPGAYAGVPGSVTVTTELARPGAYAGVPGVGVRRNTDFRFSILGRVRLFGSASLTSFKSESFEFANPSQTNSNRLSIAVPVDEPSTTTLPTAEKLRTVRESGQDSDEARVKRRKENLKAAVKGVVPWLISILMVVLLLAFLLPDKDQIEATESPTMAPSMSLSTTTAPTSMESFLLSLLPDHTTKALEDTSSVQYQAFQWLLEDPFVFGYPKQRILQRHALMTVFYSTAGPTQWFNKTGWGSYHLHECTWFQNQEFALKSFLGKLYPSFLSGFLEPLPDSQCDKHGLYQHLWLDQNNLVGSLPKELYSLTSLETLSAGLNPLVGSISSYIGQLQQLRGLAIFSTGLSGSIPKEMGSISSFEVIGLNDNKLEGSIPDELWQLSNLDSLVLGRNEKLRGTIPSSVGAFPKLRWLVLDDCDLSGTIPTELGQARSLEWLILLGNHLTGMLPSELGSLSNLWILSLTGNLLQGTLPSELGLLASAAILKLDHNSFTGTLPSVLGLLRLLRLGLESNQLSGAIPSELSGLTQLEYLTLEANRLTGRIPSEFGLLTSLGRLTMENNLLRGTVPSELASLQESLYSFRIEGNSLLSGVIPEPLCAVNGRCISNGLESCEGSSGSSFDCTELLCGCDCAC
ncbi:Leucine Rich Repeat [Seminavis robusta]|uniref:Leucine Rich Repeat n=1 Tax=Seminavis robusta TaxID=568900 RepID=A0A9N8E282_9STRA|nr:Leucine Rich Repeat [Seminavis robusta]|eukprot:Sro574_g169240.1 Leucine Rich Repeat (886) ;mRNA; r:44301-47055